jgi:hypothetical protein
LTKGNDLERAIYHYAPAATHVITISAVPVSTTNRTVEVPRSNPTSRG